MSLGQCSFVIVSYSNDVVEEVASNVKIEYDLRCLVAERSSLRPYMIFNYGA